MQMRILINNVIFVDRLFIDRFYYLISTSIFARFHIYNSITIHHTRMS